MSTLATVHRKKPTECRKMRLGDCLIEVTKGVGPAWKQFPLLGATRAGLAPAKEAIGKAPERYKPIEPGTIFYNPMRILLGSIAMVDDEERAGITSPDYVVLRTRPGVLHHRFFYYWLRSVWGEQLILSLARGAVRERILFKRLAEGEIDLPPWSVQKRVAEALAVVPALRRAAQSRLAAAEALPAAYLREVFEGPEAKRWKPRRLGDLLERHNEIIHPGDRAEGQATFVGLEHIEPNTSRRLGSLEIDLGNLTGRKPTFRRGHIVYGYLRPYLNKVWIAEFDGCSSVDQFAFQVRSEIADSEFVASFMRSNTFLRRSAIVTTTGQLPRISVDEIAAVEIELPPTLDEQRAVAARLKRRVESADDVLTRCREVLATIDALPSAYIRQAFEGLN